MLGQNVNSYRDPSPAGWDFAALLAGVAVVPGIRRVRYTTSHPRDFVRDIVEAMHIEGNETQPISQLAPKGLNLATGKPYSQKFVQDDRNALMSSYLTRSASATRGWRT